MTSPDTRLEHVLADLDAEGSLLEELVAPLDEEQWRTPTPAAGWDVATQVAHLAWTDEVAVAAATDKQAWDAYVMDAIGDPEGFVDAQALAGGRVAADRAARAVARPARRALQDALRAVPAGEKMPWFGPPMSPTSMATARFMETWAHSLDVADALGAVLVPTDRIRHVAHIGVRTRDFAFGAHGLPVPADEVRVELDAPSGETWTWGPEDAAAARHRLGVRLLPAGDPAPPPRRPRPARHRGRRRPVARPRPGLRRPSRSRSGAGRDGSRGPPVTARPGEPLRIGNCSGFYGDRLSAMRELLEGGSEGRGVDVVTGDYLAELTMLILGKDQLKDPSLGYARTFVTQVRDCLGLALEQGVRIVTNAGGLNPAGLAQALAEVAAEQGLTPRIAWVDGDDLAPRAAELGLDGALTANAYLGAFGIARALEAGADVVVTGRVTDASVVVGPAAWHHGWTPDDLDALAGAVVAGHVVECGTQATGGNFSGFLDLPRTGRPLGFPIAEVAADGSSVITKHDGTGGAVTVDTVTAQLMYEVQTQVYLGPDVTVDLTSIELAQVGPDRVQVSGVRGGAPPEQLKVCVNELGRLAQPAGVRADRPRPGGEGRLAAGPARPRPGPRRASPGRRVAGPSPTPTPRRARRCCCAARSRTRSAEVVGKPFTAPAVELALGSYPGFTLTGPPGPASPYGVYRPAYVARDVVTHTVHLPDGSTETIPDPVRTRSAEPSTSVEGPRRPGAVLGRAALVGRARRDHPHASRPPRHLRARPLRRQGRRRQRRSLGPRRRPSGRARSVAAGPPHRRARARAAAGDRAAGRGGLRPAQPARRERAGPRPARRRGGGLHPVRPPGQGRGRVVALASRRHPRGAAVSHDWTPEQRALQDTTAEFVRREVTPHLQEWEDAGEIPR